MEAAFVAIAWYVGGWVLAAWAWSREFGKPDVETCIFITIMSIFGPLIGLAWMFCYWMDHRTSS